MRTATTKTTEAAGSLNSAVPFPLKSKPCARPGAVARNLKRAFTTSVLRTASLITRRRLPQHSSACPRISEATIRRMGWQKEGLAEGRAGIIQARLTSDAGRGRGRDAFRRGKDLSAPSSPEPKSARNAGAGAGRGQRGRGVAAQNHASRGREHRQRDTRGIATDARHRDRPRQARRRA